MAAARRVSQLAATFSTWGLTTRFCARERDRSHAHHMHALPSSPRFASVATLLLGLALLAACNRGPQSSRSEHAPQAAPTLTAEQYPASLRRYYRLPVEDPDRDTLRRSLVNYLAGVGQSLVEAEDYDASVEHLATVTSLYLPSELEQHPPESLALVAEFLKGRGERAGDEARVLSALWLLLSLNRDDPQYATYYRDLRAWSEEARADYGMLTESIDGLIGRLEKRVQKDASAAARTDKLKARTEKPASESKGPEGP